MANDSDPDGDQLVSELLSNTASGVLVFNSDGSFSYSPAHGFTGSDSFSYRVSDGKLYSNQANVTIVVKAPELEPWFQDSFEGPPPRGWSAQWDAGASFTIHDTTDEQGTPTGGGQYAYRQCYLEYPPKIVIDSADHTTDTFTSEGHGLENGTPIRFGIGEGGVLPGNIQSNWDFFITNASEDTFKVYRYVGHVHNFTDNGTTPFHVNDNRRPGGLRLNFGGTNPVPLLGDGDDFSFSYYIKFHPEFDFGQANGNKLIIAQTEGLTWPSGDANRFYLIQKYVNGKQLLQFTLSPYPHVFDVDVGDYQLVAGEWIKLDFYIKVSHYGQGVVKGWINNQLRWNYSALITNTAASGRWVWMSFPLQRTNHTPLGENQERLMDLFRIGPGKMVLSEQK